MRNYGRLSFLSLLIGVASSVVCLVLSVVTEAYPSWFAYIFLYFGLFLNFYFMRKHRQMVLARLQLKSLLKVKPLLKAQRQAQLEKILNPKKKYEYNPSEREGTIEQEEEEDLPKKE